MVEQSHSTTQSHPSTQVPPGALAHFDTQSIARSYVCRGLELRLFTFLAICLFALSSLSACATRAFYYPRSEEISEAKSKGLPIRSVDEDRALFFAHEENQRNRMLSLIRHRSEPEYRDVHYRMGSGDELELNVFDVPELNITTTVRQSGFLSLPLVGAVKAQGLTEAELADEISTRLATFVRNPQVAVFITQYGSQRVAVMGAVRQPGTISLRKGSNSILELIAQAGGVSDRAGNFINFIPAELSGVDVERGAQEAQSRAQLALASSSGGAGRVTGIEIYLDQVLGTSGGVPLEVPVRGGDMIIIPEAGKVHVEGEVVKPGTFDLGQQSSLLGALAAAGGITYSAKVDEIEVIRDVGGNERARLILDLQQLATGAEKDVRLRNGDLLRVPSDSSRRLTQDTFEGLSRIINVGVGTSYNLAP